MMYYAGSMHGYDHRMDQSHDVAASPRSNLARIENRTLVIMFDGHLLAPFILRKPVVNCPLTSYQSFVPGVIGGFVTDRGV